VLSKQILKPNNLNIIGARKKGMHNISNKNVDI
jgi:hypothetical protein